MARSWAAYVLPVVVIGGGVVAYVRTEHGAATTAPSPSADTNSPGIALLDDLRDGDVIDGWTVHQLRVTTSHVGKAQLAIELLNGGRGLTIWVARKEDAANPPVTTARYAVSYGDARPFGVTIPNEVFDKLVAAIAERVRRNEQTAAAPPGL